MLANAETRLPQRPPPPLGPRKSPRQGRSRATVETIVEAAARILEADGPDRFNTNAVARRAGVSVGSLYQYFPGKQALVAELSRRNAEAAMAGLAAAVARTEGRPVVERLRAMVAFAVAQQGERPRLSRVLDRLEPGLELDTDEQATAPAIVAMLTPVLAPALDPGAASPEALAPAVGDCLALARVLIDRALDAGPQARAGLEERVVGALAGYLRAAGARL
ncbi:MAG: TetR/AcrR family transcriptional regulator [Caulobacteraceae bacterium]|nr:TetR/AcrR family transcriptional regulator [Caulobacteraceae bacterium]